MSFPGTDLYADDTIFYDVQKDIPTIKTNLQRALNCLKEWCRQNGMILNTEKTKVICYYRHARNDFTLTKVFYH